MLGKLSVQLVSKISNLCGRDPRTSQMNGRQTDNMQSQYRAEVRRTVKTAKGRVSNETRPYIKFGIR